MPAPSTVKKLRNPANRAYKRAVTAPASHRGGYSNGPTRDAQLLHHLDRHQPHEYRDDGRGDDGAEPRAQHTGRGDQRDGHERRHQEQPGQEQQDVGGPGAMGDEELGCATQHIEQGLNDSYRPETRDVNPGHEQRTFTWHREPL